LKNERSPDENCPKVYIDEVSELARDLKSKIRLARYSKIMMVENAEIVALKTEYVALKAELKASKKGKETGEGKASDSTYNPASFSAPNKDKHVKQVKKLYPSLLGITEYQQILDKYGAFYQTCVNCGKTDLKQLPCGCGKKGEESNDPKVRDMCEAFKKYRKFQHIAQRRPK
jgi:hypothetical protein